MAIVGTRVTVAQSAVVIEAAEGDGSSVLLKNTGANPVDLGASGVTAGGGYQLAVNDIITIDLAPGEELYGISATGNNVVMVLKSRFGLG